jgi:predicted anti-sigma-YlaC factor YlaD
MYGMAPARSCDTIREQLSARLDNETEPGDPTTADRHLDTCAACQTWWQQAQTLARLTHTITALPAPTLTDTALTAVLAATPKPRPTKLIGLLRYALLAIGLAQFFLGITQISSLAATTAAHTHNDETIGTVTSSHLWHESAAWNVAIGAALAWLAWRRARPTGLLPVMTAFVAVLALLTANDALIGRVNSTRILSHTFVLAGYLILLIMNQPKLRAPQPPNQHKHPNLWPSTTDNRTENDAPLAPIYPFPTHSTHTQQVTAHTTRHHNAA